MDDVRDRKGKRRMVSTFAFAIDTTSRCGEGGKGAEAKEREVMRWVGLVSGVKR